MKKFALMLSLLGLVFCFANCGGDDTEDPVDPPHGTAR